MPFDQSISVHGLERIRLRISGEAPNSSYGYGVYLDIRAGWNDSCRMHDNALSLDELIALRDLIDRALRVPCPKHR